jgi:hypothetical protein
MLDHVRGNGLRPHLKLKISSDFFFHLDAHAGKLPVMCNKNAYIIKMYVEN